MSKTYIPGNFSKKEAEMMRKFDSQLDDARNYFLYITKPRLDRAYKLYVADTSDRAKEIKSWQANIGVPYIQAVVETMMPRIVDARPEFSVKGRETGDQRKAEKQQYLCDYYWEIANMDRTTEVFTRAATVYGTGFLQVYWKKDVRELKFLKKQEDDQKKMKWQKEKRVFYDAPMAEWVDNYDLWYDWHVSERAQKQYWFRRRILSESEIRRRYPGLQESRLKLALDSGQGDITDYASIRQETKTVQTKTTKGANAFSSYSYSDNKYSAEADDSTKLYEVFEWFRPFDDEYAVMVGDAHVPILNGASMPIPFDFKEAPFVEAAYLKLPGEFEGIGIPLILESPQIMLNLIKNQRLDATTLSIHKMWIVNPLANIDKQELVTRPFGIIYSMDPQGVREVEFSEVNASAYKEEESLKDDMRYASGVDDFSMGVNSAASSATAVRHLRESTLERVRMFVNHLGDAYSDVLRYWMDMTRQFQTKEMTIRIIGKGGEELFPLIEPDDLMGNYDYRAKVLPSIAGQVDVQKKQDMDLYQLLIELPFIDQQKLTGRVIDSWGWDLDSILAKDDEKGAGAMNEMDPAMVGGQMPPEMLAALQQQPGGAEMGAQTPGVQGRTIPTNVLRGALALLRKPGEAGVNAGGASAFAQFSNPVDLLKGGSLPPTTKGVKGQTTNPRGFNRGGAVNTNIPNDTNYSTESNLLNRSFNIQN